MIKYNCTVCNKECTIPEFEALYLDNQPYKKQLCVTCHVNDLCTNGKVKHI